ncbi:MAG: endonuclease NucS domain-containing protein [Synechococcus sp.]|nr:endonuclease NucS domain-containing protein [Synechococcus sp.]
MDAIGLWAIKTDGPDRLQRAEISSERSLEDWIEHDPALLERGLVIVGRQVRLDSGRLDLLALDPQGRWVLIEIKRDRLRRKVIAQAIDYASSLSRIDLSQLRDQCNAYLQSKGRTDTLEGLLEQRGRSLDAVGDGRDVVIYLVGAGFDIGLERMVGYLVERAELAIRIVTFSSFKDAEGRVLLARHIHEGLLEDHTTGRSAAGASPPADVVLSLADQNGLGPILRKLYDTAVELGLYPRPWAKSIMFAPPSNRTRCLFVVWAVQRSKEQGVATAFIAAEAFEQFYGINEGELVQAVGAVGYVTLDMQGADRLAQGLQRLLETQESA